MNQDKLKMKSDLITKYQDKPIDYIETTISLSKIERFIYSKSTIFIFSLIVMLMVFFYKIYLGQVNNVFKHGVVILFIHFLLYKTIITKIIFKDSELKIKNLTFNIEVLTELIKNKKTSDNI